MDSQDRLVLALVVADVIVIVTAGLAGFLVDVVLHGRRWTRRRWSARSLGLFCTSILGIAVMVLLPMSLAVGVSKVFVASAGMGPWVLAIGGAVCFAISRALDTKAERRPAGRDNPAL
jgi:hypothetical protein